MLLDIEKKKNLLITLEEHMIKSKDDLANKSQFEVKHMIHELNKEFDKVKL